MADTSKGPYIPIYLSANYRIDAIGFASNRSVFVSFSERTFPKRRFAERVFSKYQLDAIFVTARGSHWYQYPDSAEAAHAVRAFCSRYDRVVTYGESMGGYGSLIFSEIIDPDLTIAFSPQYSHDSAKVPFESRWPQNRAEILGEGGFVFDDMKLGQKSRTIVFFDPHSIDARHAALVRQNRRVESVIVPFSGHATLRVLAEMKLSSQFLIEAAAHDPDLPALRRLLRERRWNSATYLRGAAKACTERGLKRLPPSWQGLPAKMIRHASEIGESSVRDLKKNRSIAMSAGDEELAAFELLRLLAAPMFYKRGNPAQVFKKTVPAILRYDLQARILLALEEAVIADPGCAAIVQRMRDSLEKAGASALPRREASAGSPAKSSTMGEWASWFAWRPVALLEAKRLVWMRHVMRRRVAAIAGNRAFWQYTEQPARFPARLTGAELLASFSKSANPNGAKV